MNVAPSDASENVSRMPPAFEWAALVLENELEVRHHNSPVRA